MQGIVYYIPCIFTLLNTILIQIILKEYFITDLLNNPHIDKST